MARGTSKSAASRHLIARMSDKLREQLNRRLDALDLLVLMLDGVVIARRTVVVALGILVDGRRVVATPHVRTGYTSLLGKINPRATVL
jgi:transposase-like protein